MNAILSVVGKDTVGILASVSVKCAEYNANVIDVSQTVINEYFAMFMFINIDKLTIDFNDKKMLFAIFFGPTNSYISDYFYSGGPL